MNQGNTGQFHRDDGIWQDGGLLLHYPGTNQWVAIFLAFQSQGWHTDDHTGHTVPGTLTPGPGEPDQGGLLTLLDPAGLKIDGVAYTAKQAELEGWTLTF